MDAMTLLARCRSASKDLESLQGRIDRLREVATSPGGHGGDGAGVRSTRERDRMAAYAAALDGLTRAYDARKRAAAVEVAASAVIIDRVLWGHATHAAVVHAYYIRRESYKEIAADMHLSVSRVKNVRLEAAVWLRLVEEDDVAALLPPDYGKED